MIGARLLAKRPDRIAARALLDGAVAQSRSAAFFERMGVLDSVEGRFEMLTLHAIVLLDRLGSDAAAGGLGQKLFDTYVGDLDGALREMGVGDLVVGKRMRALAQAFYGRAKAYQQAFSHLPSTDALEGVVLRTALHGSTHPDSRALATYVVRCRAVLAEQATEILGDGQARWPQP
jgi:cytochrome b pre-mRNA-processing protein 3